MKADKDDAPEHLRRKRGQSFGKWTLAIALGLGLGLGLGLSGLALHMDRNSSPVTEIAVRPLPNDIVLETSQTNQRTEI